MDSAEAQEELILASLAQAEGHFWPHILGTLPPFEEVLRPRRKRHVCILTNGLERFLKDEFEFVQMRNPRPGMEKRNTQEPTAHQQNCGNWNSGVLTTPHT